MQKRFIKSKALLWFGGAALLLLCALAVWLLLMLRNQPDPQATFVLGRWLLFA